MKKLTLFATILVIGLFVAQVAYSQAPSNPQFDLVNKWDLLKVQTQVTENAKQVEVAGVANDTTRVGLGKFVAPANFLVFRQGALVPKSTLVFANETLETAITFPTVVASTEVVIVVE